MAGEEERQKKDAEVKMPTGCSSLNRLFSWESSDAPSPLVQSVDSSTVP